MEGGSNSEAVALGVVIAAATTAVGYGIACGVSLVQNWETFETGIRHLVQ
jgi:hypothetical protein